MKNVRLVVNLTKEDSHFVLSNLKVVIEDRTEGTQLSSMRSLESSFENVSSLFSEIQTKAVEVFNSILNG